MKKILILVFFNFTFLLLHSQTKFIKGFFIDKNKIKVECFFKYKESLSIPTKFEYKLVETDEFLKTLFPNEVLYVYINEQDQYVSRKFYIFDENFYNEKNNFIDTEEQYYFLKVITTGNAKLFYNDYASSKTNLFFSTDSFTTTWLNPYLDSTNNFRKMIWNSFDKDKIDINRLNNLNYKLEDLKSFFEEYNSQFKGYVKNVIKDTGTWLIGLLVGLELNNVSVYNYAIKQNILEGNKTQILPGIRFEYFFNKKIKTFSFYSEIVYDGFNFKHDSTYFIKNVNLNLKSLNIYAGIAKRYYLEKDLLFRLNAGISSKLMLQNEFNYTSTQYAFDYPQFIRPSILNLNIGIGLIYKNFNFAINFNTYKEAFRGINYLDVKRNNSFSILIHCPISK